MMYIRKAEQTDLRILAAAERACFSEAEAATEEQLKERLACFPDHFWLLFEEEELVSFIDGMVTDEPDLTDEMYEKASMHQEGGAWQMLFASLMFWACFYLSEEWPATNLSETSGTAWWALFYLIVFGSMLAYSAYVWLLKVRPATEVATHAYVNPVVAVIIGGIGGEEITMIQLAGLAVILASVMLVNRKDKNYA